MGELGAEALELAGADPEQTLERAGEAFLGRKAQVEGQISTGVGNSANTEMELVDDSGKVVQRTHTNEQGNYRFKNVNQGKYKVRAKKDGYGSAESDVQAAPASAPAKASMKL